MTVFPSDAAQFAFFTVFTILLVSEAGIVFRKSRGGRNQDRYSVIYLNACFLLLLIMLFLFSHFHIGVWPERYYGFSWAGLLLILFAMSFRWYAIWWLGAFFTGVVYLQPGHRLIRMGPYRLLRHPSYTGGLFIFLGLAVTVNNGLLCILNLLLVSLAYRYRIKIEEEAMAEYFGKEYEQYRSKTWRLIPFIY